MTFNEWHLVNEEAISDAFGGDWNDLIGILRESFMAGYFLGHNMGYRAGKVYGDSDLRDMCK